MKKTRSIVLFLVILGSLGVGLSIWLRATTANPLQPATANQSSSAAVFSNSTSSSAQNQISGSFEYDVNLSNTLMLVDSRGRRTGKDPATGVFYHEIPGTGYGETVHSGQLAINGLPYGQYALYVLSGQTGTYAIDAYPPQHVTGNIKKGTMDKYIFNIDSADSGSPKLVFQSTLSSSAGF